MTSLPISTIFSPPTRVLCVVYLVTLHPLLIVLNCLCYTKLCSILISASTFQNGKISALYNFAIASLHVNRMPGSKESVSGAKLAIINVVGCCVAGGSAVS